MTTEDTLSKAEAKSKAVSEAIKELWRPEAEAIINLIISGNECIAVSAPSASGKSKNLTPMLVNVGWERGFHPFSYDCQRFPSRETNGILDTIERITQIKKENGIAVLDEPHIKDEAMEKVLEMLYGKRYVGVIGLFRVNSEEDETYVQRWINAGEKNGKKCLVYEMKSKALPLDLSRDFLEGYKYMNSRMINYIITNFPLYPRVLDILAHGKDEKEVIKLWQDLAKRVRAGWGFTKEEADAVNRKLNITL